MIKTHYQTQIKLNFDLEIIVSRTKINLGTVLVLAATSSDKIWSRRIYSPPRDAYKFFVSATKGPLFGPILAFSFLDLVPYYPMFLPSFYCATLELHYSDRLLQCNQQINGLKSFIFIMLVHGSTKNYSLSVNFRLLQKNKVSLAGWMSSDDAFSQALWK